MKTRVEKICSELVLKGISSAGLLELSNSCVECAKTSEPVLLWLGLDSFFRRIGSRMDGPVGTSIVEGINQQVRPLLEVLSGAFDGPNVIERHLVKLKNLI